MAANLYTVVFFSHFLLVFLPFATCLFLSIYFLPHHNTYGKDNKVKKLDLLNIKFILINISL